MKFRGLHWLIFCCGFAVIFIAVNTCTVSYILICCEGNVFLMSRGSWNA